MNTAQSVTVVEILHDEANRAAREMCERLTERFAISTVAYDMTLEATPAGDLRVSFILASRNHRI